jgi:hypothetical protein
MPHKLTTPTIINNLQDELVVNLKNLSMKLEDLSVPSYTRETLTLAELISML